MSEPLQWKVLICIPLASCSFPPWIFNRSIIAWLLPTLNYKPFYICVTCVLLKLITTKHIILFASFLQTFSWATGKNIFKLHLLKGVSGTSLLIKFLSHTIVSQLCRHLHLSSLCQVNATLSLTAPPPMLF